MLSAGIFYGMFGVFGVDLDFELGFDLNLRVWVGKILNFAREKSGASEV